jgi:hypothetical protein
MHAFFSFLWFFASFQTNTLRHFMCFNSRNSKITCVWGTWARILIENAEKVLKSHLFGPEKPTFHRPHLVLEFRSFHCIGNGQWTYIVYCFDIYWMRNINLALAHNVFLLYYNRLIKLKYGLAKKHEKFKTAVFRCFVRCFESGFSIPTIFFTGRRKITR